MAAEAEASQASRVPNCFPGGTLVNTLGGLQAIEKVVAGDQVWGYDLVASQWRPCRVLRTFSRLYEGNSVFVTVAEEVIEATFRHPFWVVRGESLDDRPQMDHLEPLPEGATTSGRWVDAGDLRIGDELLLRDGRIIGVQALRTCPYHADIYNFEVEELHCYTVGWSGVLVHNNTGAEGANAGGGVAPNNPSPRRGPTDPDVIAEEMGPGHFDTHGDPNSWKYLGKKTEPATEIGREAGSKKVYEVYLDENGKQIEWHYWRNPDSTVDGGKLKFPGTTSRR